MLINPLTEAPNNRRVWIELNVTATVICVIMVVGFVTALRRKRILLHV